MLLALVYPKTYPEEIERGKKGTKADTTQRSSRSAWGRLVGRWPHSGSGPGPAGMWWGPSIKASKENIWEPFSDYHRHTHQILPVAVYPIPSPFWSWDSPLHSHPQHAHFHPCPSSPLKELSRLKRQDNYPIFILWWGSPIAIPLLSCIPSHWMYQQPQPRSRSQLQYALSGYLILQFQITMIQQHLDQGPLYHIS